MQIFVIVSRDHGVLAGDEAYESYQRADEEIAELGLDRDVYVIKCLEVRKNGN